jgi:probable phosphoglycerate mutase
MARRSTATASATGAPEGAAAPEVDAGHGQTATRGQTGGPATAATEGRTAAREGAPAEEQQPEVPKPTLVLFVRHGKTPTTGAKLPGRAPGLHLSPEGRRQAEAAARRIAKLKNVAAVYASPLERTQETAAPIAASLGLPVTTDAGLLECEFGEWTGAELKELFKRPEWRQVQTSPSSFRFPSGESFPEMQVRICSAVGALVGAHPGATVVAVSHADPIKAAVAAAVGTHLDLFQRIVVSPCSISAVQYNASGAPVVLAVNSTGADLRALVPS